MLLALVQGFILQQAWEPELDIEGYLTTAMHLVNSVLSDGETKPIEMGTQVPQAR